MGALGHFLGSCWEKTVVHPPFCSPLCPTNFQMNYGIPLAASLKFHHGFPVASSLIAGSCSDFLCEILLPLFHCWTVLFLSAMRRSWPIRAEALLPTRILSSGIIPEYSCKSSCLPRVHAVLEACAIRQLHTGQWHPNLVVYLSCETYRRVCMY